MLKITVTRETAGAVHLSLDGKVAEQWAALLDGVCRSHLRKHQTVLLDCEHVEFVDVGGVEVLKNLPRREVKLVGAPNFMTQLLNDGDVP